MLYYRTSLAEGPVAFSSAAQTLPSPVTEPEEPQLWDKPADSKEVALGWEEGGSKRQLFKRIQEDMHTCNATWAKWTHLGQASGPEDIKCHLGEACSGSGPSCSCWAPREKPRLRTGHKTTRVKRGFGLQAVQQCAFSMQGFLENSCHWKGF